MPLIAGFGMLIHTKSRRTNLGNNLWGTNFSMWWEGSLTFHFVIEKLVK